jgi:cytidyltransferase-like protein
VNRTTIFVSGGFDRIDSPQVRFLQEAGRRGAVHACLWTDAFIRSVTGRLPEFPLEERRYILESLRFVEKVIVDPAQSGPDTLPVGLGSGVRLWAMLEGERTPAREAFCRSAGLQLEVIPSGDLAGFPLPAQAPAGDRPKVVVTGCYDWLHSGHVRFFEEASGYGDLYVGVGSDATVRELKGAPHPMFPQDERRYLVQAVRFVTQAFINSGSGWLDAAPDIERLRPETFVVNEDGDRPEKRRFCEERGIRYVVLKRLPKEGLPNRASTELRGF